MHDSNFRRLNGIRDRAHLEKMRASSRKSQAKPGVKIVFRASKELLQKLNPGLKI